MNSDIKSEMRNNVIVQMRQYVNTEVLNILDDILIEELRQVAIERMETLPAEVQNTIDERNKYIIELFLCKKAFLAKGTLEDYLRSVKMFLMFNHKALNEVTDIDISCYLNWYERRNVNNNGKINRGVTVNNERKFLSAFFGWMRKEKMIESNPVEAIPQRPEQRGPIDCFTRTEMEKLREACASERDRAILEVLRSTGARVGEVLRINRFCINWETGDVMVQSEKKRTTNSYRLLYLDEECRYHLQKYLSTRIDNNPCLFIACRAPYNALKKSGVEVIMKNIGKRAGLECRVYPHKMRKTLGMTLREKGVDIGTIQEVLGHEDTAITVKYYASSTADTLRQIRKRAA